MILRNNMTSTRKDKMVKAWAVLENGKLVHDIFLKHRPLKDEIDRPWIFPYNRQAVRLKQKFVNSKLEIVPVLITFKTPKGKKKLNR